MIDFTTRFLLRSQRYAGDNAMMKTFNKYIAAKLEDAAIEKETKRTSWSNRKVNSDNSSWNLHNKSM